jgi:CRISPR-associated endonuclease/helicase Cas3
MYFSFRLKSHNSNEQKSEDGQLLIDHLQKVSKITEKISDSHGIEGELKEIIKVISMCHDFGKASQYFQRYLKGEYNGQYKNHGEISAYFAYYLLPEKWKLTGFLCIKKHHGNLEPNINFFDYKSEYIQEITRSIEENKVELEHIYNKNIDEFFKLIKSEKFLKSPRMAYRKKMNRFSIEDYVKLNYLWSLLLTADKSQLINDGAYQNTTNIRLKYVENFKEKVRKELIKKEPAIEKTSLFNIRNEIYKEAIENIKYIDINKDKIFSINVPTGTGKTLTAYGAAFKLLEKIYTKSKGKICPSIIYTLPFTSVIDQNYNVLEDILNTNEIENHTNIILKHHSMTELEYSFKEKNLDEAREYKNYDARFCVENWQSTIITTTFVQLFNTIFKAGKNSIINRFHKLAGSIIILDEVQAIPPKYFTIIEKIFNILCNEFNCYVITLTATKPLFLEGKELINNNERYFKQLDRIEIHNNISETIDLDKFCKIISIDIEKNVNKSFLIVLNTIKSSQEVLLYLKKMSIIKKGKRKLFYLSTEIHPAKRLEVIKKIKEDNHNKYILVSTQLIEAGVDIDFDIVYRDFSPIDSINQTAGRANRNAIGGKGLIKLYSIENVVHNNKKFARYIYPDTLLNATEKILKYRKVIKEDEIYDINQQYFKEVDEIRNDDTTKEVEKSINRIEFKKLQELFKLIEDNYQKEDIIINFNEESQQAIDTIINKEGDYLEILNAWRRLNKYKVSINKKDLDKINYLPVMGMNILNKGDYDEEIGIIRKSYEIF